MKKMFPETLTRLQYLLRLLIIIDVFLIGPFILFGIAAGIQMAGVKSDIPINVATVFMVLFVILMIICRIQIDFARLRSLGWSPWCVLLLLVPIANLVVVLFLFFGPPVNDTSDDSDGGSRTSRILIWLAAGLVVPVIMGGLIAAIAIPNFVKAKAEYQKRMAAKQSISSGSGSTTAPASATGKSLWSAPAQPASPGDVAGLRVDSIHYNSKYVARSSAVINGNSVMTGDAVGSWRVFDFSSNTVTLRNKNGEMQVLSGK